MFLKLLKQWNIHQLGRPIKPQTRHCPICKKALKTNDPSVTGEDWVSQPNYFHPCPLRANRLQKLVRRKYRDTLDAEWGLK